MQSVDMERKSKKTFVKVIQIVICSAAVGLAVSAMIYNPAHLFTAGLLFLAGCSIETGDEE